MHIIFRTLTIKYNHFILIQNILRNLQIKSFSYVLNIKKYVTCITLLQSILLEYVKYKLVVREISDVM